MQQVGFKLVYMLIPPCKNYTIGNTQVKRGQEQLYNSALMYQIEKMLGTGCA